MKPTTTVQTLRHGCSAPPPAYSLQPTAFSSPPRRGSAIIVVVGLLAILFIAAVAFTELMRVARSASSNYRHTVGARQMLYTGLAEALADIDADPTDGGVGDIYYPPWTNRVVAISGPGFTRTNVEPAELLFSIDGTASSNNVTLARVLSAATVGYLPRNLLPQILGATIPNRPEWKGVKAPDGSLVGRYAYVIANVSGLLDANEVAKTNRWMGATPGEIALTNTCPVEITDPSAFLQTRKADIAYETLKDLADNAAGLTTNQLADFEVYSYSPPPSSDFAPDGKPKLYIGGDFESRVLADSLISNRLVEILGKTDILGTRWTLCSDASTAPRISRFIYSLFDFLDTNTNTPPRSFCAPRTKRLPMLRRLDWHPVITNIYASSQNHLRSINNFDILAYCPGGSASSSYQADLYLKLVKSPLKPNPASLTNGWTAPFPLPTTTTLAISNISFDASSAPLIYGQASITYNSDAMTGTGVISFTDYKIEAKVKIRSGSTVVEQVPGAFDTREGIPLMADHADFGASQSINSNVPPWRAVPKVPDASGFYWCEAVDPRFNWEPYDPDTSSGYSVGGLTQWLRDYDLRQYTNSLKWLSVSLDQGDTWSCFTKQMMNHPECVGNSSTQFNLLFDGMGTRTNPWSGAKSTWKETFPRTDLTSPPEYYPMPIICRPLQSLGELGFIPLSYWFTVRLATQNDVNEGNSKMVPSCGFHRFLDYFTLSNNVSTHGFVNINTRSSNVLAAVVCAMPRREWYTTPDLYPTNWSVAFGGQLAAAIQQLGPLTNLTDLGSIPFWTTALTNKGAVSTPPFPDKFSRESFIRNSLGMLTVRQQYFTIIVRADSLASKFGYSDLSHSSVLGSAQAVFQVWRDPVATPKDPSNPNGPKVHRCFIRLCKIIND